jgi:hypothetical protein
VLAITVVEDAVVAESYAIDATPSAVLVGADGRIDRPSVAGAEAIEQLVDALVPAAVTAETRSGNGRIALAGAAGGAVAVSAAAQAAPPTDPELKAIDATLRAAEPRLVAASTRSLKAIRALVRLKTGQPKRAKRTAARKALASERREVLALRGRIDKLPGTGTTAHNVKVMVDLSLSLLGQSLTKREQAIGATPSRAPRLLEDEQRLFLRAVGSSAAAGKVLGRGS